MDLLNYDNLYMECCYKFVLEGKGTVSDFCRLNNLSSEHFKCFTKYVEDKLSGRDAK